MIKHKSSTLVHGCDIISSHLKYCLSPMGLLFKFDPHPPHQPSPLSLLVVLLNGLASVQIIPVYLMFTRILKTAGGNVKEAQAVGQSLFIVSLSKFYAAFRICTNLASYFIVLSQHGSMANVIASSNNFVSEKEQSHFARLSFTTFFFKTVASCFSFLSVAWLYYSEATRTSVWLDAMVILVIYLIFVVNISHCAPMMYACYLGSSLGKHVENFSKIYVDTMFDQFLKVNEADNTSSLAVTTTQVDSQNNAHETERTGESGPEDEKSNCLSNFFVCRFLKFIWKQTTHAWSSTLAILKEVGARLNSRKYPELPEMQMTKLSTTANIQISGSMIVANSHLIRIRLRRTQVMLSELRDLVSDINKTSTPIVLMYLIYETLLVILITTASIQAKVYKSIGPLIMPTVFSTVGLVVTVIYTCTCLDETTKQLKLLINKLFDFIIMNHRVQSTGKHINETLLKHQLDNSDVCLVSGNESDAINETWSQFQYTRKLANTIQFTMGGILPVTRRLVLTILGHILSAVFISIEIMSIIDTSPSGPRSDGHALKPSLNATAHG